MAQQNLDFGTGASGDGEDLFSAFTKIEANFTEVYTSYATLNADAAKKSADNDFGGHKISNARAPVNAYTADRTLGTLDKGSYVHMNAAGPLVVTLPASWLEGEACVIRRVGTGAVTWALASGASAALPASRASDTGIAEQHEEILVRVVSNADGTSAVWAISGATA